MNNLEYYRVFYHVAKTGSLTLAAGELMISQPAVSQSIKQLETALGTKLFVRASRGIRLTGEGELLYRYVAKGYEQIALGEQRVRQMLNLELGEIHIGASDMTLRFYLLPYLEVFHERYPGIKVIVSNAPTPETLMNLKENKIDLGVVSTPFENKENLRAVQVREIEDVFVAGRRFMQKVYPVQEPYAGFAGTGKDADYLSGRRYQHKKLYGFFSVAKRRAYSAGVSAGHQ